MRRPVVPRSGTPSAEWVARTADQAARFLATRGSGGVVAACEGFLLQVASETIAERDPLPCWGRLDAVAFLAATGGDECAATRAMALGTALDFYAWLASTGELDEARAGRILDDLARLDTARAVRRRSDAALGAIGRGGAVRAGAARPGEVAASRPQVPQKVCATRSSGVGSAA